MTNLADPKRPPRDKHGVAGATLRLLQNGADAQRLQHSGDLLGLVPDDSDDGAWLKRAAGADHMLDESEGRRRGAALWAS